MRYVGEAVAAVVAEDPFTAQEAPAPPPRIVTATNVAKQTAALEREGCAAPPTG